jgi:hypothetical protein
MVGEMTARLEAERVDASFWRRIAGVALVTPA